MSLLLLVGVAAPVAAIAQAPISNIGSGSTDERLAQLERFSNAHSQLLTQLQQQLADSQRDIDMLRGQIQENQYQLNQVVERQRNIYQQLDSLGGGASTSTEATQPDNATSSTPSATTNSGQGDEKADYNAAIDIVSKTCAYTNHTILAEALEKWPIEHLKKVVPQLVPIIEILDDRIRRKYDDPSVAIIDKEDRVHMAHMDIHYGFSVNGVA